MDETLKLKWTRLVEWVLRSTDQIDTRALYPATIISSDGNRASVKPDDPRLGLQLSNKPVRRPDGFTAIPAPGMRCLIGWDGYREDGCFILLGFDGNGTVSSITLDSTNSITQNASNSITLDSPLTTATHDLASEHELGITPAVPLQVTGTSPVIENAVVTGDDTSFELTFDIADMQTLTRGGLIATVTLSRPFLSVPRGTATAQSLVWGSSAAAFVVKGSSVQQLLVYWMGNTSLPGPMTGLIITVFVRGSV